MGLGSDLVGTCGDGKLLGSLVVPEPAPARALQEEEEGREPKHEGRERLHVLSRRGRGGEDGRERMRRMRGG